MTRLIVNGDDFGMCEGVTLGILKAHRDGILCSTTMMVGMPFAAQAAQMAKDYPNLGIGIHFTLTAGKPVSDPKDVPSLVEADGTFHSQDWHIKNKQKPIEEDELNYEEVYCFAGCTTGRYDIRGSCQCFFDIGSISQIHAFETAVI